MTAQQTGTALLIYKDLPFLLGFVVIFDRITSMLVIPLLTTKGVIGSALPSKQIALYALSKYLETGLCGYKVATIQRRSYNEATLNTL